jgi:DNA-binding LytR/AlgR family response regulator
MTVRAVIVDDEPLARTRLRRLLAEHPAIEIAGEAGDGEAACRLIDELSPDLVFLDVQMPGLSGFDVLARLDTRPRVIFITAHDEFAVRAFEAQAIDYLLKPVEPARLARALARVTGIDAPGAVGRIEPATGGRIEPAPGGRIDDERLTRLIEAVERRSTGPRRIAVRRGPKVILVEPASILFVRAEDKYTVLYTAEGEHILDRTIEDLEQTLDPSTFLRIHRSVLVNLACVRDLTAVDGGRFVVSLKDAPGTTLYASRAGAKLLREKLGF